MADGTRHTAGRDDAEAAAVAEDERLLRRSRLRLVLWSGLSTLAVLIVLAAALYAVTARTLETASVDQLLQRTDAITGFLEGDHDPRGDDGPDPGGFLFGSGNTLLYLFDDAGRSIAMGDRPPPTPTGLPTPEGIAGARAAADGIDVQATDLTIESRAGSSVVPIRILTRRIDARDGNTYFAQALQDRATEVGTLDALLTVLLAGGIVVVLVSFGFGALYARRALVPIRDSLEAQRGALRRQREFAADASHELRTPLTVIRSSVEHLERHRDAPIRPGTEAAEALDDIDAEVSHLSLLVDDLLLLARTDSGAVTIEKLPLDLGDVASDAASGLGRLAEDRGVRLELDPAPAMLDGDAARLRQLVTILVDNAIRHSPRGGTVSVTVRAEGAVAAVEVADQGPGVRPEDVAHVFDRFYRAAGAPSGGTGLGLAIARWIVERHGGRIGVRSPEGGGAVFRAELPASDGPRPTAAPGAAPDPLAG